MMPYLKYKYYMLSVKGNDHFSWTDANREKKYDCGT